MGKNSSSPTSYFCNKLFDNIIKNKNKKKAETFSIPKFEEYNLLLTINFNVKQLRKICKKYKQKKSGNKDELIYRLYNYLKYSFFAIKIQKLYRKILISRYNTLKGGPLLFKNGVNEKDFVTLEKIEYNQLICYKKGTQLFKFDICSLYNYIKFDDKEKKNPYTQEKFPVEFVNAMYECIRLSRILNLGVNIKLERSEDHVSEKKKIEFRVLNVFQKIDNLGNITNVKWFMDLSRLGYIKYIKELYDIWFHRASLTPPVKLSICPPSGNPFYGMNIYNLHILSTNKIIKTILYIIDTLISSSQDREYRVLGAYYSLAALTLVSRDAAYALPWLYNAVI